MTAALTFAHKPTLTGDLVVLRPVQESDAAELAAMDAESVRLTGSHRTFSRAELEQWYASRGQHSDRLDLAIIERATGLWAGEVVLNELDPDNRSCGFRILLTRALFFGRGLGTEASELMLTYAFGTIGLHRIELEVYAFNPRARHVYDKLGFVHEGVKRQALRWDGQWIDAHLMAILASDWVARKDHQATQA